MSRHDLKTWPEFFDSVTIGIKPFEVRYDDRGINCGDTLCLREWHPRRIDLFTGQPCEEGYTGRSIDVQVTYRLVLDDAPGFPVEMPTDAEGGEWVVLGIRNLGYVENAPTEVPQ